MKYFRNQKGVTFWGFIGGVIMIVMCCYLLILGIPPYLNNEKLNRALEDLASEPKVMEMHRVQMINRLNRKLNIDYGKDIVDLKQAFKVKTLNNSKKRLSINYELVVPVAYNVSLLFNFKNEVDAPLDN